MNQVFVIGEADINHYGSTESKRPGSGISTRFPGHLGESAQNDYDVDELLQG